ncbi:CLUMA_CG016518, isoform A, partial [Clunio marinus]
MNQSSINQHFNSMLEQLSSLRRKNSDSSQSASSDKHHESNHKKVNDIDSVNNKSKNSIFKNFISENGATNIFHNLIKCPETISSHLNTATSSSSNGTYKQNNDNHNENNNNKEETVAIVATLQPTDNENNSNLIHKKRNSVVKTMQNSNGDLTLLHRELSPSPRVHRKSSHDIRLLRNNQMILESGENGEVGKLTGVKPLKTKNIITKHETFDMLNYRAMDSLSCTSQVCMGSVMMGNVFTVETRKSEIVLQHAKDFLNQYFTSIRRFNSPAHQARWKQIEKEIQTAGGYQLNDSELIFGAKTAWRNSARCIGRIQWSKLQVFDCRQLSTPSQMFEALCNHLKYSTNKGNLSNKLIETGVFDCRSAITIFPQRTDGKHDFRIWNPQLVSYAGYQNNDGTFVGDPMNVEITDLCLKLGWKSPRTEFDILPLVLSANGHDPEMFEYPPDLILEVPLVHPQFKWFADMNLKWYAVPAMKNNSINSFFIPQAVSSMLFDCGGLVFPGCAFSGWYMSTEIGCRNLCDTNRRNLLEPIAIKMGLDTRNPSSLWKDKALVEINIAVLHSYQRKNITIVDHHTASESFMKHYENESKLRKGCPADWVWIVPPMSASVMQVFHQEMVAYYLRPSFEYQEAPMKTHIWKKGRESIKNKKPRRKFHFKQIARAVKFTSKLFGRALSRRIKATVLYASETGRSEQYAKQLVELLSHAFNAQIYNMAEYDISSIEHEALLFVVASTFGNGDPPENGEQFAQGLYAMKMHDSDVDFTHL